MKIFWNLTVVRVAPPYEYTKNQWLVHFKMVHFIYEFYLNLKISKGHRKQPCKENSPLSPSPEELPTPYPTPLWQRLTSLPGRLGSRFPGLVHW